MASDGRPEKSLFARIKDCIITEFQREREYVVQRSPCPSRPAWGWPLNRGDSDDDSKSTKKEIKTGVEGLKKGQSSSDKSGTSEDVPKKDNAKSKHSSDTSDKKRDAKAEKNDSGAEPNLSKPDKFQPRRYYIKMQNPEALPCCVTVVTRRVGPPKTRKLRAFDDDSNDGKPACKCSSCSRN